MTFRISGFLLTFSIFLFFSSQQGFSQPVKFHEEGPVHEAFVTKVAVDLALEAVPLAPPHPMQEKKPRQLDIQSEWIPGYWSWNKRVKDFVWVSGVWRRPPPAHQWVSGFWKQLELGFVWIPGYWSPVAEHKVSYIGLAPPDALDENPAPPPSNHYFWVPGYWSFLFDRHEFFWVQGHWEELDPSWIFVPSHYTWRPGGYVFIPGFWDWPLEQRGTAFASATVDATERKTLTLEPMLAIKPATLIRNLFPAYPDYLTVFQHHLHFHADFWKAFCCEPAWWDWSTWWCFSWHQHWSLWWWYTHPGYPEPSWMTPEIRGILPPPPEETVLMLTDAIPPAAVTPDGVVSRDALLSAVKKATGQFAPILPYDQDLLGKIYHILKPERKDDNLALRPIGRKLPIHPSAVRPSIRKPVVAEQNTKIAGKLMATDLLPKFPPKPKIPTNSRASGKVLPATPGNVSSYSPPAWRPSWSPRERSGSDDGEGTIASQKDDPSVLKNWKVRDPSLDTEKKWRTMDPESKSKITRPPFRTPSAGRLQ